MVVVGGGGNGSGGVMLDNKVRVLDGLCNGSTKASSKTSSLAQSHPVLYTCYYKRPVTASQY